MKQSDIQLLKEMLDRAGTSYQIDCDDKHGLQFVVLNEADPGADKFGTAFTFDTQGSLVMIESYVELLIQAQRRLASPRETLAGIGLVQELAAAAKALKSS